MLFVDVNLGRDKGMQRLVLYEDDEASLIVEKFSINNNLNDHKKKKLEQMLTYKMEEHRVKLQSQR